MPNTSLALFGGLFGLDHLNPGYGRPGSLWVGSAGWASSGRYSRILTSRWRPARTDRRACCAGLGLGYDCDRYERGWTGCAAGNVQLTVRCWARWGGGDTRFTLPGWASGGRGTPQPACGGPGGLGVGRVGLTLGDNSRSGNQPGWTGEH